MSDVSNIPLVRVGAYTVAAVFLLVGVLGFIPGVTSDYDQMQFAGHESGALLLGVFGVSILHNLVHLVFGVVGAVLGRTMAGARGFLIGGGAIYALLWIYGLLIDKDSGANFVPMNSADDWLHFALALVMIGLGVGLSRSAGRTTASEIG